MSESLTYFITWTTYGTWLPGDSRGWMKNNDIEIVDDHDQTLERIITYITEAQERKDRDF